MRLDASNLAARRGEDLIFADVSFRLDAGEALVLTGKNGSGKSTLLRVVAGLLRPERGTVEFTDSRGETDRHAREVSHYLGHRNAMKSELTVSENLAFWQNFLGDVLGVSELSIEDAAEAVGLSDITHLPFGYLSAGQQRRFAFAKLLVAYRPGLDSRRTDRSTRCQRRPLVCRSHRRPPQKGRHRCRRDPSAARA